MMKLLEILRKPKKGGRKLLFWVKNSGWAFGDLMLKIFSASDQHTDENITLNA
jgi:hypothetical protein